jgi:hypothetical protein
VRNFRVWASLAMVLAAMSLVGCGGHSSSNASVRLVNATLTHTSISLLANSGLAAAGVAINTTSAYTSVPSGAVPLQINDATANTVLAVATPTLASGQNYAVVAYESGGQVRTTLIQENTPAPASGTASLRVFDTATDAGAIDVYVTDPSTNLSTLSSPTFSFSSLNSTQATSFLSLAPGQYRIRVTGSGNTADLRLDMPSITIVAAQNATVLLTPTTGGTLANGAVLVEQGTYAATPNTNLRVRLVAAVSNGAVVGASAGASAPIAVPPVSSPSVGAYALVPAGSTLTITVNGAAVTPPDPATLTAGSDTTLLIYGNAGAPVANLIEDDNHLPIVVTNFKMRLVNGVTGAAPTYTLDANFSLVASNVPPDSASPYAVVGAGTGTVTRLDVLTPSSATPIFSDSMLNIPGNAVYTMFLLGDVSAPIHLLQRDH